MRLFWQFGTAPGKRGEKLSKSNLTSERNPLSGSLCAGDKRRLAMHDASLLNGGDGPML
jgi:hypothetical protein